MKPTKQLDQNPWDNNQQGLWVLKFQTIPKPNPQKVHLRRYALIMVAILIMSLHSLHAQTPINTTALPGVANGRAGFCDFNQDGYKDILITGAVANIPSTQIWRYDTTTASYLQDNTNALPPLFASAFDWADYDNDGDQDLLLAGASTIHQDGTYLYRNQGNGILAPIAQSLPGNHAGTIKWADWNGDGSHDIYLSGYSVYKGAYMEIYEQDTQGNFQLAATPATAESYIKGGFGDFDGNGTTEIVLSAQDSGANFYSQIIEFSNGNPKTTNIPLLIDPQFQWADLEGMGSLIMVGIGLYKGDVSQVTRQKAGNNWLATNDTLPKLEAMAFSLGKLNGDPLPDMAICGFTAGGQRETSLWVRYSNSYFPYAATLPGVNGGVELADFDNDGDDDLLLFGEMDNGIFITRVYRNDAGTFVWFQ